jgi:hypothetical protein
LLPLLLVGGIFGGDNGGCHGAIISAVRNGYNTGFVGCQAGGKDDGQAGAKPVVLVVVLLIDTCQGVSNQ